MTHTFVELEVSQRAYAEIAEKFRVAGYDHAFLRIGGQTVIDMHGIGIRPSANAPSPDLALPITGAELIAAERRRQIEQEGWMPEHDDEHDDSSLALAAICFAAPQRVYIAIELANGVLFTDPWPDSWNEEHDKRFSCLAARTKLTNVTPDPAAYTHQERISYLVKAGALIAAEIDRLARMPLTAIDQ